MYSLSRFALRRNLIPCYEVLKPFNSLLRFQKTEAVSDRSGDQESATQGKPFQDIPGRPKNFKSFVEFYWKSERFTKGYKMLDELFQTYGPIFKEFAFLGTYSVHLIDPVDQEKALRAEGKYPTRVMIDFWLEHRQRRNYFPGILLLQGEEWYRVRHSVAPKIMRPKIMEENIDNFTAVTKDAIARLAKLKEECGSERHIPDLEEELSKWATESVGTLAFDSRLGLYEDPPKEEAMRFITEVHNFFSISHKLFFSVSRRLGKNFSIDTPLLKKFFKTADTLIEIGEGFVDKKMNELKEMSDKGIDNTQAVPLLTYLLTKKELTPQEVVGVLLDVVGAGVDTTANTTLWMLYNLGRNPHVQDKLYQEVESVVGKDADVTSQSLAKLSYLKACLKETMRLHPVISANSRILDEDIELRGYHVPAGTFIVLENYCTARSEKYFEDPLEYKPERWLREQREEAHAFASIPFGFGPRMCLGRRLAELEIYLFVCKLLQRFQIEYNQGPLEMYQKILMVPDKPVKIKLIDRR